MFMFHNLFAYKTMLCLLEKETGTKGSVVCLVSPIFICHREAPFSSGYAFSAALPNTKKHGPLVF